MFGVVERGGRIHTMHMPNVNRWNINTEMKAAVAPNVERIMTD